MFLTIKLFWKNLDYYRKVALISMPLSIFLLLLFILFGDTSFIFFSKWFLDLIPIPAFIGTQLSGLTYLGRQMDLIKENSNQSKYEKWGTLIGITLGLLLGIAVSVLSPIGKSFFDVIQAATFTINCVSSLGGLGNRLSSSLENRRLLSERRAMSLTAIFGLGISIALFVTASAAMVSVVGVTSFLTGGAALPLWISGFIFVTSLTSSLTSTADYSSKAVTFIRSKFSSDNEIKQTVNNKRHEYRGSLVGMANGLIIGAVIVAAIAITQPYLFAGFLGVVAAAFIITMCVSIIGGLCSRIGRVLDRFSQINTNNAETESVQSSAQIVEEATPTKLPRSLSCPELTKKGVPLKESLQSTSQLIKQLSPKPNLRRCASSSPALYKIEERLKHRCEWREKLKDERDRHSSKVLVRIERIRTPLTTCHEEANKEAKEFDRLSPVPVAVY